MSPIAPGFNSRRVLNRFLLRLLILAGFAALGVLRGKSFATTFPSFLVFAAGLCIGVATMRRELIFGNDLTNWDEAAAFLFIGCTVILLA